MYVSVSRISAESINRPIVSDPGDVDYEPSVSGFGDDDQDSDQELASQAEINFIAAKLSLSQRNAEFLTKRLKKKKFTSRGVHSTAYRNRQAKF